MLLFRESLALLLESKICLWNIAFFLNSINHVPMGPRQLRVV
jgi:hypothetical protein